MNSSKTDKTLILFFIKQLEKYQIHVCKQSLRPQQNLAE